MVIALIICIPITAAVVGFLVLKSVCLGLKWQMQTKEGIEPELKDPITETVQTRKVEKQVQYSKEQFEEWINGGGEK
jgi:hypothetical protein